MNERAQAIVSPVELRADSRAHEAPARAAGAAAGPPVADIADRFINRELSWLHFNRRVLEEAENPTTPLLERVRFLSISASNLDEFYMVRVAGLKGQVNEGIALPSADGLTPQEQLDLINEAVRILFKKQDQTWRELKGLLAKEGIHVVGPGDLSP